MKNNRRHQQYFERIPGVPTPIPAEAYHTVAFGETDPLRIAWHGNAPRFFEQAWSALARKTGLTPAAFEQMHIAAPVVQFHADYHKPLLYGEEILIRASQVWEDAPRMNIEYQIFGPDGTLRVTGYTVQIFTDLKTGSAIFLLPPFYEAFLNRWNRGEIS